MIDLLSRSAVVVATILCIGWAVVLHRVWGTTTALRRLPSAGDRSLAPQAARTTKVSVVVAARNEAAGIEASVRSLLAQEGVDVQVIAVDDNSEDATKTILDGLAKEDARLLVLQTAKIPPGWVAKNYALELGQGRADGEFILFTDADVVHGPRALYNAVAAMERERLDHLAVHPRLEAGSLVEALVLPLFFLLCQFRFLDPKSAQPDSGVGTGIGAFNLVRADGYRLRGTHATIRGAMLDDRALGRMMRDDGGRGSVMRAVAQVRLRPYRTLSDLYVGIRKGVLATFGNSAALAALMGLVLLGAAALPPAFVLLGLPLLATGHAPWPVLPAIVAVVLPMIAMLKARTMLRFEPLAAVLFPVGAVVIAAAALHAAFVFGTKGTVEWRGRLYTRGDMQ